MSMHKTPLSELEIQGLKAHGLPVGKSSAMADCFRLGMAWAHKAAAKQAPFGWYCQDLQAFSRDHFNRRTQLALYLNPMVDPDPKYLLGGTRFKLSVSGIGGYDGFNNYPELDGRLVALVAAEDNRHMLPAALGADDYRATGGPCKDNPLENLREIAADTAHALLLQLTALQEQGVDITEFLDGIQPRG